MRTKELILEASKRKKTAGGDCFRVAGHNMITSKVPDIKLVHAYVTGQGPVAGKRFAHAWNEIGDVVIDNSNGRNVVLRKEFYYDLGKVVTEPGQYAVYDKKQLNQKMLAEKTWGPWDLDSQYENIEEMSLSKYQTMGDFDKPGPFRKADKKLVPSEINRMKAEKFFNNSPYDFRLFFSNLPRIRKYQEHGIASDQLLRELFGDQANEILAGRENSITVVYLGNYGADKVPLTPWVMAHRLGHAIEAHTTRGVTFTEWQEAEDFFFQNINNILIHYYGVRNISRPNSINWDQASKYRALFRALGTQRSSRTNQIKRPYEFIYELLAQYIGTGQITLNPLPDKIIYGAKAWGRGGTTLNLLPEFRNSNERKQVTDTLARDMGYMFDQVLSACVGYVFLM